MQAVGDLLYTLQQLESELHAPNTRKTERVAQLLSDDFIEYGSSGRIYTKAEVMSALDTEPSADIAASDFSLRLLAPNLALLQYVACRHSAIAAYSLRSSIWQLQGGHWRMLFHQDTPRTEPIEC